jgi:hypothetical protein
VAGAADLVSALTGGDRIEQQAYSEAAQRIVNAQAAQALMDKRVEEANRLARESAGQKATGRALAAFLTAPGREVGTPLSEREMASLMMTAVQGGVPLNQLGSATDDINKMLLRGGAYNAALGNPDQFSDYNRFVFSHNMEEMPAFEAVGDLAVRNLYGNAQVDPALTEQMNQATARSDRSGAATEKERRILRLMQRIDPETGQLYTRQRAEDLVLFEEVIINPVTGEAAIHNSVSQTVEPIAPTGMGETPVMPPVPLSESFYGAAPEGTGPRAIANDLWARGSSLVGGNPDFTATTAISNITTNLQQIIRGLSINDKNAVTEQERLLEWLKLEPSFFTSPATFRARISGLNDALMNKLEKSRYQATDQTLAPKLRRDAQNDVRTAMTALNVLGHPKWMWTQVPEDLKETVRSELVAHPQWNTLSEEQKQELLKLEAIARYRAGYSQ